MWIMAGLSVGQVVPHGGTAHLSSGLGSVTRDGVSFEVRSAGQVAGRSVAQHSDLIPAWLAWGVVLLALLLIIAVGWALWRSPSPFERHPGEAPDWEALASQGMDELGWGSRPPSGSSGVTDDPGARYRQGQGRISHRPRVRPDGWVLPRRRPADGRAARPASARASGASRPPRNPPVGPDDDEAFLRQLGERIRRERAERERLRPDHPET